VLETLVAIQSELARLSGPKASADKTLAGAAVEAPKKEAPDKDEIGGLPPHRLKTAREGAEFAGMPARLAALIRPAPDWLNGRWLSLKSLLT
jgi:hypothetical protein